MKNRIISISLAVMLALSIALISCANEEAPEIAEYNLTIFSTAGGSVTTPGEGTYTYAAGTVVTLVAEPSKCYRFVNWIGDVTSIANVDATATTITMNDNYVILASFVSELDLLGKLTRVEADPQHGFHWAYYLYVPSSLGSLCGENQTTYLLVEPNNTGYTSDNQEVHDTSARALTHARISYAKQLDVALLVPTFPRPQRYPGLYIQALDRSTMLTTIHEYERIDLQLLSMVDHARNRLFEGGIAVNRKILMCGFSASGMFVSRFAAIHPDRIQAAAIGAPGGWPIAPVEQWDGIPLTYPAGIADMKEVAGKEFDIQEFRSVPLHFYMGDRDTNECWPCDIPMVKAFGKTPVERWPIAEQMYKSAGCNSQFVLYPGVGHWITDAMWADTKNFFLSNMESR